MILNIISDVLFIADLIITCFTAYYNDREELIVKKSVRIDSFFKFIIF